METEFNCIHFYVFTETFILKTKFLNSSTLFSMYWNLKIDSSATPDIYSLREILYAKVNKDWNEIATIKAITSQNCSYRIRKWVLFWGFTF